MLEKYSTEEPFLKIRDGSHEDSLDLGYQKPVQGKHLGHVPWLRWSFLVLYIPAIALFAWSYVRWSNFQQPREHYVCPDMIPCKLEHTSIQVREKYGC